MLTILLAGCGPADVVIKGADADTAGLTGGEEGTPTEVPDPDSATPTGEDTDETTASDPPPHRAIATSRYGSCLVTADGGLWCWGGIVAGEADAEPTWFDRATYVEGLQDVAAFVFSRAQACAGFDDGNVRCWDQRGWTASEGRLSYTGEGSVSLGTVTRVAVGDHRLAWVDADGRARVMDGLGDPGRNARTLAEDAVDVAAAETDEVCALGRDGRPTCTDPDLPAPPSDTRFRGLAVASGAACAVEEDGDGICWSRDRTDRWSFGDAAGVSMSGDGTGCWLREGGQAEWWDARGGSTEIAGPPPLSAASCTSVHGCGIGRDGGAWCWGADDGALGGEPDANGVAAVHTPPAG